MPTHLRLLLFASMLPVFLFAGCECVSSAPVPGDGHAPATPAPEPPPPPHGTVREVARSAYARTRDAGMSAAPNLKRHASDALVRLHEMTGSLTDGLRETTLREAEAAFRLLPEEDRERLGEVSKGMATLLGAIEQDHVEQALQAANDLGRILNSGILSDVLTILIREHRERPVSALKYMRTRHDEPGITPEHAAALSRMIEVYEAKGDLTLAEGVCMVIGIVIEIQFGGHGVSIVPLFVLDKALLLLQGTPPEGTWLFRPSSPKDGKDASVVAPTDVATDIQTNVPVDIDTSLQERD